MPEKAAKPVPDGMHTVTTHLYFDGNCREAIDFYQKALGAESMVPPVPTPDGTGIMHAMMRLGDSHIMMADAWPGRWEKGPKEGPTASLFLYVEDCDAFYSRAIDAGCEVVDEMMDTFWGDRMGMVKDPFGHSWAIASHKWLLTEEEMQKGMEDWLKSLPQ